MEEKFRGEKFRGGRYPGKVAVGRARSYDTGEIKRAVREVFAPFGGVRAVAEGARLILLKPNVLRPARPEEAVTTHPEVVRAVALEFMEAGYEVAVGDSPGGDPGPALPAFEKSGIAAVCRDLEIPLLNFQKEGSVSVDLPYSRPETINVAKPVAEADCIINLPKLKTHTLTQLTCALKNPYGYIPGFLKGKLHTVAPKPAEFVEILCAIWEVFPPAFSLLDAVVGMEGQGPSGGSPRRAGFLLGGTDPVALDTAAAWAMGFDPREVLLLLEARRRNLGAGDPDRIEVINGTLDSLRIQGFELPVVSRLARFTPDWLVRVLRPAFKRLTWIRPRIAAERCEKCHRCVRSCPTGALRVGPDKIPRLAFPRFCISCLRSVPQRRS